jgi:hypothetical protein
MLRQSYERFTSPNRLQKLAGGLAVSGAVMLGSALAAPEMELVLPCEQAIQATGDVLLGGAIIVGVAAGRSHKGE